MGGARSSRLSRNKIQGRIVQWVRQGDFQHLRWLNTKETSPDIAEVAGSDLGPDKLSGATVQTTQFGAIYF